MNFEMILVLTILIVLVVYVIKTRNKFAVLQSAAKEALAEVGNYEDKRNRVLDEAIRCALLLHENEVNGIRELSGDEQYDSLMALGNKFPDLKTDAHYTNALSAARVEESHVASSRSIYHQNVTKYNDAITLFPANIVAKILGYERETLIEEENLNENKKYNTRKYDINNYK